MSDWPKSVFEAFGHNETCGMWVEGAKEITIDRKRKCTCGEKPLVGYVNPNDIKIRPPIPRDERGLVTPQLLSPTTDENHKRIVLDLASKGSWLDGYDIYSFMNHGGLRQTYVLMPNGEHAWLTTKTKWDPPKEDIADTMRWRFHGSQLA